ncbi:MAG: gliding motility-associated C-terminal domain-containing protein [Tannerella sp.]|jgi:gliding motility-associated-like protein|nr:gliding motility-associated C-terminal domain-containing protein [Tannerella sp.]
MLAIWLCASAACAQYAVNGGRGEPLLAADNTQQRIRVYLLNGMDGATLSYTSATSSHRWFRYRTRASEAESVASSTVGNTSTVDRVEEGYGYFVQDGDNYAMSQFVWLIDYSLRPVQISNLRVAEGAGCEGLRLSGENTTAPLLYHTPGGLEITILRSYEASLMTQIWNDAGRQFTSAMRIDTLEGDPFARTLAPPLEDTEIQLSGDLFARHFGLEKTFATAFYQAVALEVHADTTVLSDGGTNMQDTGTERLAPAEIRFGAHANTPVASLFIWQIYRSEDMEHPLVRFTGPETEYTFSLAGSYVVRLEVSDRTGVCTNTEHTYNINITETVVLIPNAFTPEGSPGVNDVFRVVYKSVSRFQGVIFNRWGAELYRWTDPAGGWDGTYRRRLVPAGPYFYVIDYTGTDGKTHRRSGDINVIRSSKSKADSGPNQ